MFNLRELASSKGELPPAGNDTLHNGVQLLQLALHLLHLQSLQLTRTTKQTCEKRKNYHGNDEATSTLYAKAYAKAFYSEYAKGKSASSESTCVKAALGYAGKSFNQDPSRAAAMLAYLDAKIAKKSDKEEEEDSSRIFVRTKNC